MTSLVELRRPHRPDGAPRDVANVTVPILVIAPVQEWYGPSRALSRMPKQETGKPGRLLEFRKTSAGQRPSFIFGNSVIFEQAGRSPA